MGSAATPADVAFRWVVQRTTASQALAGGTSVTPNPLDPADAASAAVDAHVGVSLTWDYYKNVHGRNGIANNGVGAYNRVHYSRNYNNAFWSDSCFCMTYGDGDGTTFNRYEPTLVSGVASATTTLAGALGVRRTEASAASFGLAVLALAAALIGAPSGALIAGARPGSVVAPVMAPVLASVVGSVTGAATGPVTPAFHGSNAPVVG